MIKHLVVSGLMVATMMLAAQAKADLCVSRLDLGATTVDFNQALEVRCAISNPGQQPLELRVSLQVIDDRGVVLYASAWSNESLGVAQREVKSWKEPLGGLLDLGQARKLHVYAWVEMGSRQYVASRATLVRSHETAGLSFVSNDAAPAPGHAPLDEIACHILVSSPARLSHFAAN